ncbi:glycosyltransferase [Roseisalinus antarcticus]|nr:glycosyltransferase [Roseisalinus antarcticus]
MRFVFTSTHLSGHLLPLLRYGQALRDRGQEVRFASTEAARPALEKAGLELFVVDEPPEEDTKAVWERLDAADAHGALLVAFGELFGGITPKAAMPRVMTLIEEWQPDLILRECAAPVGLVAAQKAGLKSARIGIMSDQFYDTHRDVYFSAIDRLRVEAGLSPDAGAGWAAEQAFTSFPEAVDRFALDDGQHEPLRVRPLGSATKASAEMPAWKPTDGRPLLYITLGTVSGRSERVRKTYLRALEAVSTLPVQALLTTGPIMQHEMLGTIPDNVFVETFIPQAEVFEHASAVVNHGGSGTFIGALAAGLPQVVVPLFADQPANARALEASGAGISVYDSEVETLRAAMERVLVDEKIRAAAARVAAEMAGMRSMDEAVDKIEALATDARAPH